MGMRANAVPPILGAHGERLMIRACAAAAALLFIAHADAAAAADIKGLSGSATEPAMALLIPQFERQSGHKVILDSDAAIGAMTERVLKGEAADVVIVSGPQIARLEQAGRVVPGTRADIAKVGVGLFVRKGTARPDIGSVEAFKRTLLAARSIGWNDPAAGAPVSIYMLSVLQRLGIADDMRAKTVTFRQRSERFAAVARGDVEIGFNQVSEILAAAGVELLGPLPGPIQNYTLFAGAVASASREPEAAQALLRFLASPAAQATWKAKGFEAP